MTTTYAPTKEQAAALELFAAGKSIAIEAGAGTGKTSTLVMLANSTTKTGQYTAFNKAIVKDSGEKFPKHVSARTAHSLAYGTSGRKFSDRLNAGGRQSSWEMAKRLRIDPFYCTVGDKKRVLQPAFLAGQVMKTITNFCKTADEAIDLKHFPYIDGIDIPSELGRRTYDNNLAVRKHLAQAVTRAWEDLSDPYGQLYFKNVGHGVYLKLWQLSHPTIGADLIFLDEAQDTAPVLADVIARQEHAQLVVVGDSQQELYAWAGAVNAMAGFDLDARTFLTNSFRFGPEIAGIANLCLEQIPSAELRITGAGQAGRIGVIPASERYTVLTRTNAGAISEVLDAMLANKSVHLVGGGGEVERFVTGAQELMTSGSTNYGELCCFDSWRAVQDYVANDPQGDELALMVKLIDEFGIEPIQKAVANSTPENRADVVVSTAHKSKGREWDNVALAGDFPDPDIRELDDSDYRLLYVAATRARKVLNPMGCTPIAKLMREASI